jgi:protein-tyrosine phosphatase
MGYVLVIHKMIDISGNKCGANKIKGFRELVQMRKIIFVCHGNICRSTMAEFVMKELVRRVGLENDIFVRSAATTREAIGGDTHPGTKAKLREKGIPFTKRQAVQLTSADYAACDYIVAMDQENLVGIRRILGADPEHKVHLMLDFTDAAHGEVADPWYTGDFEATYADVLRGCQGLLTEIRHGAGGLAFK